MLLIYQKSPSGSHVPLKILSIETGDVIAAPRPAPQHAYTHTH